MYIGKVIGKVVSTVKDPCMQGMSLVLIQRMGRSGALGEDVLVAVDRIGCGEGNMVLLAAGSAARMAQGCQSASIDLAVTGIVDNYNLIKE